MSNADEGWYRRLSRKVLVENPWHRYCHDRYTLPGGGTGEYFYVDMPGSCGAIPLFEDGSTLLVRVRRYLLGRELWEFPIGGMKDGEVPIEVAGKELREETGYLASDMTPLGSFAPYKGVSNELCHFFLARGLTEVGQELEPSEQITVHRLPWDEARGLLLEQEVGDGQSLSGLLLYERWLARGGEGR